MIIGDKIKAYKDSLYVVFRVFVGLLFFQHGLQKLLAGSWAVASMIGWSGILELFIGLAIALGLFSRLFAGLGAIEMLFAYFIAHHKFGGGVAGWAPILNRGELSLLFFAAFLVVLIIGNGKFALERLFSKKELM